MSAIKRALKWIQYVINNYGFDSRRLCVDEAHAIKRALEEEQKREKGCRYCNDASYRQTGHYIDDKQGEIDGINHYCMNCGRKLV